jgi:hypothetical protein
VKQIRWRLALCRAESIVAVALNTAYAWRLPAATLLILITSCMYTYVLGDVARGITSLYAQRKVVQCGRRYNVLVCAEEGCAMWHEV